MEQISTRSIASDDLWVGSASRGRSLVIGTPYSVEGLILWSFSNQPSRPIALDVDNPSTQEPTHNVRHGY